MPRPICLPRYGTQIDRVFIDAIPHATLFGYLAEDGRTWVQGLLSKVLQPSIEERHLEAAARQDSSIADDARPVQRVVTLDASSSSLVLEDLAPLLSQGLIHLPSGATARASGPLAFACEVETLAGLSPAIVVSVSAVSLHEAVLEPTPESVAHDLALSTLPFPDEESAMQGAAFLHALATWTMEELESAKRAGPLQSAIQRCVSLAQHAYEMLHKQVVSVRDDSLPEWAMGNTGFDRNTSLAGCCLVYAAIWALGGCLTPDEVTHFEDHLREILPDTLARVPSRNVPLFHCVVHPTHLVLTPIVPSAPDTIPVVSEDDGRLCRGTRAIRTVDQ